MDANPQEHHSTVERSSTSCNRLQMGQLYGAIESAKRLLIRGACLAEKLLAYSLAMFVGAAIGSVLAWCAGNFYVERHQPVYLSDYSSVDEISSWQAKPLEFAADGRAPGAIAGIAVLAAIHSRSRRRKV